MKIKCPNDGAILTIVQKSGVENAFLTCPVCKQRMRVKQFQRVASELPTTTDDITEVRSVGRYGSVGVLVDKSTGSTYALAPGRNIIGRKSSWSSAGIQLTCSGKRTSREHIVIEVEGDDKRGYAHHMSLYKKEVNATFVGQLRICPGEKVILQDGEEIRLPDASVLFKIPQKK